MPRSYISQLLFFPLVSPDAAAVLRNGLRGTLSDIPYLASEVLGHYAPKNSVTLGNPGFSLDDLFSVLDLTRTIRYSALRTAGFMPSALAELNSHLVHHSVTKRQIVFQATLALLDGGAVLSVNVHHSTTDITGFSALLAVWASHCKYGTSESLHFSKIWLDRDALFNTPHHSADGIHDRPPSLLHWDNPIGVENLATAAGLSQLETCIFRFPAASLQQLKRQVLKCLESKVPWVSTMDILTALIWSAIISAEMTSDSRVAATKSRHQTDGMQLMRIPVNFRSLHEPPLPEHYLGAAFAISLVRADEKDLCSIAANNETQSPSLLIPALARVATAVRTAILAIDGHGVKAAVEYIAAQEDLERLKLSPQPAKVSIVSWAAENVYGMEWGSEVSRCESVRLPELKGKRYPIILPRLANGDFEVLVRLNLETMDLLRQVWVMNIGKG